MQLNLSTLSQMVKDLEEDQILPMPVIDQLTLELVDTDWYNAVPEWAIETLTKSFWTTNWFGAAWKQFIAAAKCVIAVNYKLDHQENQAQTTTTAKSKGNYAQRKAERKERDRAYRASMRGTNPQPPKSYSKK